MSASAGVQLPDAAPVPGQRWTRWAKVPGGAATLTLADQGIVSACNFALSVLLARGLGLERFGVFALGWTVVLFALSFSQALVVAPLLCLAPGQLDDEL